MNNKLHLIMPMGGGGTRFGNKGFNVPKPLIELQGAPFFYWAAQSIVKFLPVKDITFVVLKEHIERFGIDKKIRERYPKAIIAVIPKVLEGAVMTCLEGVRNIHDDNPILFNDCDHAFISKNFYSFCRLQSFNNIDGALLTFQSTSPAFSYVKFDAEKKVIGTIEKKVVSEQAICGAYYFRNAVIFRSSANEYIKKCDYSEYFVSGVYNEMVKRGLKLTTFPTDIHVSFGTPEEYESAENDNRMRGFV